MRTYDLSEVYDFLKQKTQSRWLERAMLYPDLLLVDHAHCEKKAASSAFNLMYRYADKIELLRKMSRLAREELRHFEQVLTWMNARGIAFKSIPPGDYASVLRQSVRTYEPCRLIDTLIVGAIIEARSCERFYCLTQCVDAKLADYYYGLLACEARHFQDYLNLAKHYANEDIGPRIAELIAIENEFMAGHEEVFRFHSPD